MFTWVQQWLIEAGLLKGKSVAIHATTLSQRAMRSIVRLDTAETYQEFLTRLEKSPRSSISEQRVVQVDMTAADRNGDLTCALARRSAFRCAVIPVRDRNCRWRPAPCW